MLQFIARRLLFMVLLVFMVTVLGFVIIQLPPGDWLTSYILSVQMSGDDVAQEQVDSLRELYGLDRPLYEQYARWVWGMVQGKFGYSFFWNRPVKDLIWERIGYTMMITGLTLVVSYVVAIPTGIYSAVNQYRPGDYVATFIGFLGMSTPPFLLALILMYLFFRYLNVNVVGLFSSEYLNAPWSADRVADMLYHLPIPIFVVGLAGVATVQRIMRASLLDELRKQYVETARSKGLSERTLLFRYPVRVALNPVISTMGWMFPLFVGGGAIVAIVLNLPTLGPLLLSSLRGQDMYLAAAIVTILSILTVVGFFVSDILLMLIDPRIRME